MKNRQLSHKKCFKSKTARLLPQILSLVFSLGLLGCGSSGGSGATNNNSATCAAVAAPPKYFIVNGNAIAVSPGPNASSIIISKGTQATFEIGTISPTANCSGGANGEIYISGAAYQSSQTTTSCLNLTISTPGQYQMNYAQAPGCALGQTITMDFVVQ